MGSGEQICDQNVGQSTLGARLSAAELDRVLEDPDAWESSEEDKAQDLIFPEEDLQGPPSEELAQRLIEHEKKLMGKVEHLKQKRRKLKAMLVAYKKKEKDFVLEMDAHMEEVERTEHELSQRIETLTAENQQLRSFTDKRVQENSQQVDDLHETTKHCSESETRVQFLVDRIVALLSTGSGDPAQTEAVLSMRQREQEMLRQLEETRQQFDEVRQQNGELTSRLSEELALSRRLSDQLSEVEERFFHNRVEQPPALPAKGTDTDSNSPSSKTGRLGPRPMGLRSDQTEAPPERADWAQPPALPRTSESQESRAEALQEQQQTAAGGSNRRTPLKAVLETEAYSDSEFPEELASVAENDAAHCNQLATSYVDDSKAKTVPPLALNQIKVDDTEAELVGSWKPPSYEAVLLMEQKLRDALDNASFECAVVRVETGIYNFGPNVRAVVELNPENEVVASRGDGVFEPIDEFIRSVASESRRIQGSTNSPGSDEKYFGSGSDEMGIVENVAKPPVASDVVTADRDTGPSEANLCGAEVNVHQDVPGILPNHQGIPSPVSSAAYLQPSLGQWQSHPVSSQSSAVGSNPVGSAVAVPALNALSALAPPPPAHSTSGRMTSPRIEVGGARTTQGPASALPLHAASLAPMLGQKLTSSNPERIRMSGMPSPAVGLPGPLISPRPLAAQKPAIGSVGLSSNPRVVLTNAGTLRMGVAQQPGAAPVGFCPQGMPSQLHFPN